MKASVVITPLLRSRCEVFHSCWRMTENNTETPMKDVRGESVFPWCFRIVKGSQTQTVPPPQPVYRVGRSTFTKHHVGMPVVVNHRRWFCPVMSQLIHLGAMVLTVLPDHAAVRERAVVYTCDSFTDANPTSLSGQCANGMVTASISRCGSMWISVAPTLFCLCEAYPPFSPH